MAAVGPALFGQILMRARSNRPSSPLGPGRTLSLLGADSAYLSLQLRHNSPDTWSGTSSWRSRRSSPGLSDHRTQTEQISQAAVGPPTCDGDERIGLGDIGPVDGHGGQSSVVIGVEDAVLAPGLVDGHEFERASGQRVERMGDTKNSMRTRAINGI